MKIDFLVVRPGPDFGAARPFPDLARPLAEGLCSEGRTAAILTLGAEASPPPDHLRVFRLDYPARVAAGERFDPATAHRYGVTNFRRLAFCEHIYVQVEIRPATLEQLAAQVPASFAEVHRLFEEHEVGCVIHAMMGGEILREVVTSVARRRGIPVLYNSNTRYFGDRVLFVRDTRRTPFTRPRIRFADLPSDKQKRLRDYFHSKQNAKPVEKFYVVERKFLNLVKAFVRERKFMEFRRLLNGIRRARLYGEFLWTKRYWKRPEAGQPYVYFPLQYSNECTIIIGAPQCYDQAGLIDMLSRSLPGGLQLCFKQHPNNPAEGSSLGMIRRSVRLPNAQLLPVSMNSWDVARRAEAVVTIDNTVGFEALLLRRPVVALGYPAYRGWGVTTDVTDLNDLPAALESALAGGELSEERLWDFLASFESVHIEGNWFDPPYDPGVLARTIREQLARLQAAPAAG